MKKQKIVCIIVVVASLILSTISYFVLPEEDVIQINSNGQPSNIVPKLYAIAIPLVIALGGIGVYWKSREKKALFAAFVGILVSILTLLFNH